MVVIIQELAEESIFPNQRSDLTLGEIVFSGFGIINIIRSMIGNESFCHCHQKNNESENNNNERSYGEGTRKKLRERREIT